MLLLGLLTASNYDLLEEFRNRLSVNSEFVAVGCFVREACFVFIGRERAADLGRRSRSSY